MRWPAACCQLPAAPRGQCCARTPASASRWAAAAAGAKGFGSTDTAHKNRSKQPQSQHKQKQGTGGERAVDGNAPTNKAVEHALHAAGAARPVDPSEAAKGRLDVAMVRDWGSGERGALGDLQVTGLSRRFDGSDGRPLSAQLAQLLAQLEAQGALRVADGGRPLPPFERWHIGPAAYTQYLADSGAAHTALAAALDAALAPASPRAPPLGAAAAAALGRLGRGCWLHRGEQLGADLRAMVGALAGPGVVAGAAGRGGGRGAGAAPAGVAAVVLPAPGGGALAFAAYMGQLAASARSPARDAAERDAAALRLLACAYSLLASFLSVGARAGAAAAERAGAAAAGALAAYTDYPGLEGRDPAAVLVAAVDAAGGDLAPGQRQVVFDELPRAFPKAALLLSALAAEE